LTHLKAEAWAANSPLGVRPRGKAGCMRGAAPLSRAVSLEQSELKTGALKPLALNRRFSFRTGIAERGSQDSNLESPVLETLDSGRIGDLKVAHRAKSGGPESVRERHRERNSGEILSAAARTGIWNWGFGDRCLVRVRRSRKPKTEMADQQGTDKGASP
jgi:hypothetical protein